ncbi:2TM domain-containing protein [Hymenobacter sp. BT730]|uniref:2TM domain-containing protein n=1 Tax=Hymenobacter sp. BT730 TaxID=3063332 RepID=UPI0026DF16D4|nr:2TM domain-containing protein [Hymenobacter sp. BT730]
MEPIDRDPQLWRMAQDRARFKSHLFTYLWVNTLLWTIWFLTDRHSHGIPWPVWSTVFWGLALVFRGFTTYGGYGRKHLSEREYERLVRQREGRA